MKKMIVIAVSIFAFATSTFAAEGWIGSTYVAKIEFIKQTSYVCIFPKDSGWRACFDASAVGGKEKLAAILSAKSMGSEIEISTDDPTINVAWFGQSYRWLLNFNIK